MQNPILQMLNINKQNQMTNIYGLVNALRTGNPDAMFNQLMSSNPQFKQFVDSNKGKSTEQIAQENGIDINLLQQFMR